MTIRDIAVAFGFEVDKSSERQAESSIKGLKSMATKLLGSIAVVFSVSKLTSFAKDCVQAASDVQEMENKFDVVFDNIRDEVDQWAEEFANAVGRNKNTIKTYLADQQNLLVGFGMTREEGAKLSEEMTSLALDLASFSNTDETVAVNAMTKAVMGESEAAKTLGAVLNDTTRAETMAAMGLSGTYNSLDQLTKMQVNYNTILRQSPDAVGDCIRSMDSYEAKSRQLSSAIAEFKEFIGGQLLPIFAVFIGWFTKGVKAATAFAKAILLDKEENNRLLKVFDRIHTTVKKLQPAISRMAQTLSNGMQKASVFIRSVIDRFGGVENVLKIATITAGAFIAVLAASKITRFIKAAGGLAGIISKVAKAFNLANLKVMAIIAVIVILTLIVEDFINFMKGNDSVIGTLFNKAGIEAENAREAIFNAWRKAVAFLAATWEWIKSTAVYIFETVKTVISNHMGSIMKSMSKIWNGIKTVLSVVWENISGLAQIVFGGLLSFFGEWSLDLEGIFDFLVSCVAGALQVLGNIGDWISKHKDVMDTLVVVLGSIAAAIGIVKVALLAYNVVSGIVTAVSAAMAGGFSLASVAGGILAGVMTFLTSPITIVILAIAALIAIGVLLYKNWDKIKEWALELWGKIKSTFQAGVDAVKGFLDNFKKFFEDIWNSIVSFFQGIWNGIVSFLSVILAVIIGIFSNILSSISNTIGSIKDSIVNGINSAVDFIKGLPSQAIQWGADFIGGFKDGILSGVQGIVDAVKGIGDKIKSFLHFSVPDEGPLTDYESWMPDFMSGLAEGISNNEDTVLDKVKRLANGIATLTQAAVAQPATATTSTVSSKTSNVTQNVNIDNTYSGGSADAQKAVSQTMKKSATDATTQMARALAYSRG